jgi:hypothetical protein
MPYHPYLAAPARRLMLVGDTAAVVQGRAGVHA